MFFGTAWGKTDNVCLKWFTEQAMSVRIRILSTGINIQFFSVYGAVVIGQEILK